MLLRGETILSKEFVKLYEPTTSQKRNKYASLFNKSNFSSFINDQTNLTETKNKFVQFKESSFNNIDNLVTTAKRNFNNQNIELVFLENLADVITFIKKISRSQTIVKTQSQTIAEIEENLLREGFEIVDSFKDEYKLKNFASISNALNLSAESRPINSLESFQQKTISFHKDKLRNCLALIGVNAISVEPPEVYILQHFSNISRVLNESRDVIFLAGTEKLLPDDHLATLQTYLCSLFGSPPITSSVEGNKAGKSFDEIEKVNSDRKIYIILLNNGRFELSNSDYRELLSCISCRSCISHCPTYGFFDNKVSRKRTKYPLANLRDMVDVVKSGHINPEFSNLLWSCSACKMCSDVCPMNIDLLNIWQRCRRTQVESGRPPSKIIDLLENTFLHGNPWGLSKIARSNWMKKIDLNINVINENIEANVLLYGCCYLSFEEKTEKLVKDLSAVLQTAEINFGVLGENEKCCGNEILQVGENGLFDEIVTENTEKINSLGITDIVTLSPHCYNAFKNDYRSLNCEVKHYSTFLLQLISLGKLQIKYPQKMTAVYHDPCYLGRHNGIYEDPRMLLEKAGVNLKEFRKNKADAVCCGGGGGRMWTEESLNEPVKERVKEAVEMEVEAIFTSCPFCYLNLDEAVKAEGLEERLKILDISEIVKKAIF